MKTGKRWALRGLKEWCRFAVSVRNACNLSFTISTSSSRKMNESGFRASPSGMRPFFRIRLSTTESEQHCQCRIRP